MKLDRGQTNRRVSLDGPRRASLDGPRRPSISRSSRRRSSVVPTFLPLRQQDEEPRRPSVVKTPFLLPTFTETDSGNEPKAKDANEEENLKEKRMGFKGLAKAILKQGTLSNLLKVSTFCQAH